jgi:hypothetical protein
MIPTFYHVRVTPSCLSRRFIGEQTGDPIHNLTVRWRRCRAVENMQAVIAILWRMELTFNRHNIYQLVELWISTIRIVGINKSQRVYPQLTELLLSTVRIVDFNHWNCVGLYHNLELWISIIPLNSEAFVCWQPILAIEGSNCWYREFDLWKATIRIVDIHAEFDSELRLVQSLKYSLDQWACQHYEQDSTMQFRMGLRVRCVHT